MICVKPILTLAIIALFASQASASTEGKLIVKEHPSYHTYDYNSGSMKLSDLKELLLAVNGFSTKKMIDWKGLKSTNSLASPKVTLLFLADGDNTELLGGESIPIDEDTSVNFQYLHNFYDSSNGLVETFETVPTEAELKKMDCSNDSVFYVVKMSGAEDLNDKIDSVVKAVKSQCAVDKDDLLVYILSTENQQRVRRAANDEAGDQSIVNRAVLYSDNYPVMFHLLFWTSLILGLAVIGIVCGMSSMDPGLDTVIYRMTSQRIKKDN